MTDTRKASGKTRRVPRRMSRTARLPRSRVVSAKSSHVSKVLPRKKRKELKAGEKRKRMPLPAGMDPVRRRELVPEDSIPPHLHAKWMDELFAALWLLLHSAASALEHDLPADEERAHLMRENVIHLFDKIVFSMPSCPACTHHYAAWLRKCDGQEEEEEEREDGHDAEGDGAEAAATSTPPEKRVGSVRKLVEAAESDTLARALHALHNEVNRHRKANPRVTVKREDVPYERLAAQQARRCHPWASAEDARRSEDGGIASGAERCVVAWLRTEFDIKLLRDLTSEDRVTAVTTRECANGETKEENYMHYIVHKIGYRYQSIHPYGEWNPYWKRLLHISDPEAATGALVRASEYTKTPLASLVLEIGAILELFGELEARRERQQTACEPSSA